MSMAPHHSHSTRLGDYIAFMLPWAHGHQLKGITDFVHAILEEQTACQAQLARCFDNQEAASKRLWRLIHNERLGPNALADAVLAQAILQLPRDGTIRLAVDWTIEDTQHLLVVSLIMGRRGVPIYWRAYDASVLKGRMKRYEQSVIRRVITRLTRAVDNRRLIVTADRGFADVSLFRLLIQLGVRFIIRVKSNTHVAFEGCWQRLGQIPFRGNERHRSLGDRFYCESDPERLWLSKHRKRDRKGHWGIWHLVSNHHYDAKRAANEYARRFGCEEGFRDAKWWLGFAKARIGHIKAWSRMFALFAIALLVIVTLGSELILVGTQRATRLMRRVASRRHDRWGLGLVSAVINLLQRDRMLYRALSAHANAQIRIDFRQYFGQF